MNIVIIGPAHPLRGGLASYNERLAMEFQQQGHTAIIYTFSLQYPGFLFPGTTQYATEPAPANLDIRVRINSINPLNWLSVGRELKKLRPDIIIVRYWLPFMGPCLGSILRIAKKNRHTKVVCIADNIIPHEKRFGDVPFTRYFVPPVDVFVTMSEKVLADLPRFAPGKPAQYVAHPLYDNFGEKIPQAEARQHLGLQPDEELMLFFGFIRKYKGLDILLDAMKLLKEKLGNATPKLLVAGECYEDEQPFFDQLKQNNIEELVTLKFDYLPGNEVKYYLCAADLVVQPYRSATQSGVTPLAYHFEVPMVVTNVGGLPAMVPEGKVGLVAEPNAASIAAKIEAFFEKGKESFLPGLQEEKKKYRWSKLTETIFKLADGVKR